MGAGVETPTSRSSPTTVGEWRLPSLEPGPNDHLLLRQLSSLAPLSSLTAHSESRNASSPLCTISTCPAGCTPRVVLQTLPRLVYGLKSCVSKGLICRSMISLDHRQEDPDRLVILEKPLFAYRNNDIHSIFFSEFFPSSGSDIYIYIYSD